MIRILGARDKTIALLREKLNNPEDLEASQESSQQGREYTGSMETLERLMIARDRTIAALRAKLAKADTSNDSKHGG